MAQGTLVTSQEVPTQIKQWVTQLGGAAPTSDGLGELYFAFGQALYNFKAVGAYNSGVLGPTGAIAETMPRAGTTFVQNMTVTGGTLQLQALYLPANTVVANFNIVTGSTASSGVTHNWMCLTDSNRNLLAISADNTTTDLTASTLETYAVANVAAGAATSFTTTTGGLYYLGFVITVGTTLPTLAGVTEPSTAVVNLAPKLGGTSTGSLTTPSTFPTQFTTITTTASQFYGFVS